MTDKKTTQTKPVELNEDATGEVQGGFTFTDLVFNNAKSEPKTTVRGFSFGVERE